MASPHLVWITSRWPRATVGRFSLGFYKKFGNNPIISKKSGGEGGIRRAERGGEIFAGRGRRECSGWMRDGWVRKAGSCRGHPRRKATPYFRERNSRRDGSLFRGDDNSTEGRASSQLHSHRLHGAGGRSP